MKFTAFVQLGCRSTQRLREVSYRHARGGSLATRDSLPLLAAAAAWAAWGAMHATPHASRVAAITAVPTRGSHRILKLAVHSVTATGLAVSATPARGATQPEIMLPWRLPGRTGVCVDVRVRLLQPCNARCMCTMDAIAEAKLSTRQHYDADACRRCEA